MIWTKNALSAETQLKITKNFVQENATWQITTKTVNIMKLNQKLIQQLRNGEIAVKNNGTLEQLREVIKEAFPGTPHPSGSFKFYQKDTDDKRGTWDCFHKTNLPIKNISDFYQPELFTGWAKDDCVPRWIVYFKDGIDKYGFDDFGNWYESSGDQYEYSNDKNDRPATYEEIEQGLAEEAKRRGYKMGVTCLFGKKKEQRIIKSYGFEYLPDWMSDGGILSLGGDIIFYESTGQWAEIVEKPQPEPIHYTVEGTVYSLDYQHLKLRYEDICQYTDEQFLEELPQIADLACIVSTLKGLGTQATIGDKGIIHELIHLMTEPNEPTNSIGEIREKFNRLIKLS